MNNLINRRVFLKQGVAATGGLLLAKGAAGTSHASTSQAAFLYDSVKCINCGVCERTCEQVNGLPEEHNVIRMSQKGAPDNPMHITRRHSCMLCKRPSCVRACPTGATFVDEFGLASFDADKCMACGYCVDACPFKHPELSRFTYFSLRNVWINRCTACGACAQACPEKALFFGFRHEILELAENRLAEIKSKYPLPRAQLYGEEDLNLIWILADDPYVYDLPGPTAAAVVDEDLMLWKDILRPGILSLSGVAIAVLGVVYFFARRNHKKEVERLKQEGKL